MHPEMQSLMRSTIPGIILIQFADNILVHFSGHRSSYNGSIEANCLSGRSAGWKKF